MKDFRRSQHFTKEDNNCSLIFHLLFCGLNSIYDQSLPISWSLGATLVLGFSNKTFFFIFAGHGIGTIYNFRHYTLHLVSYELTSL